MKKTVIFRGKIFNKYEIDKKGNIFRKGNSQPLKPWDDQRGYLIVTLMDDDNIPRQVKIHQASAHTYHGPQPLGYIVEHKDANKYNNSPANLEYTTQRENVARAQVLIKNKVYLDKTMVDKIKKDLSFGKSVALVSSENDLHYWIVRDIKIGKTYNF